MSGTHDYAFRLVRVKRGTDNVSAEISYTALPMDARAHIDLELQRNGLSRWLPLHWRVQTVNPTPAEGLRSMAREILQLAAESWEGTGAELAVVITRPLHNDGKRLVERARVEKSDARRQRERIARKLGKGVTHSRYGVTLAGTHAQHCTWEDADRFVRSRLTADELRTVPVFWSREHGWDNFDNVRRSSHRVFADAVQLLHHAYGLGGSTAWHAGRGTLSPAIAETIEALAEGWTGTGPELLTAAQKLTEEVNA
jgi:hypothetical protein